MQAREMAPALQKWELLELLDGDDPAAVREGAACDCERAGERRAYRHKKPLSPARGRGEGDRARAL